MDISQSQSLHLNNELKMRLDRFLGFLKVDPKNITLRLETVDLAVQLQSWDLAENIIINGLELYPENSDLYIYSGILSLKKQQFSLACEQFEFAINRNQNIAPSVLYNYAFALFYCADYEKALSILVSIKIDEDALRKPVLVLSAHCLHHLDKREEAIEKLHQLSIEELDIEVNGLLALLLYETETPDEALRIANQVLLNNPLQLEALLTRASIGFDSENYEAARMDFATAAKFHPLCGRAWLGLGQIDLHDFEFDKAQSELEIAAKNMPNHIGTWHLLAWVHIMNNRATEAKYALDRSYEIDRNFGETHGGYAVVAAMQQEKKLAEQHIRRAKKLNPNGFAVYYAEMLLLNNEGKQKEAKALYDKVLSTTHLPSNNNQTLGDLVKQRMAELNAKHSKTNH